ncbi:hypothetical protein DM02DRAFT_621880 [Periconia macrospinosa]|uniref:Uncharacterized protein n=1 Tax=Periconia macrospinosa TaxID=97972 RepID=A0A2V1ECR1_9PLEO|nr:hypothetical protein DM02DRAFT_621880 [Periconia macrospinosa]
MGPCGRGTLKLSSEIVVRRVAAEWRQPLRAVGAQIKGWQNSTGPGQGTRHNKATGKEKKFFVSLSLSPFPPLGLLCFCYRRSQATTQTPRRALLRWCCGDGVRTDDDGDDHAAITQPSSHDSAVSSTAPLAVHGPDPGLPRCCVAPMTRFVRSGRGRAGKPGEERRVKTTSTTASAASPLVQCSRAERVHLGRPALRPPTETRPVVWPTQADDACTLNLPPNPRRPAKEVEAMPCHELIQ